jgi:hypothetical protein
MPGWNPPEGSDTAKVEPTLPLMSSLSREPEFRWSRSFGKDDPALGYD